MWHPHCLLIFTPHSPPALSSSLPAHQWPTLSDDFEKYTLWWKAQVWDASAPLAQSMDFGSEARAAAADAAWRKWHVAAGNVSGGRSCAVFVYACGCCYPHTYWHVSFLFSRFRYSEWVGAFPCALPWSLPTPRSVCVQVAGASLDASDPIAKRAAAAAALQ